ncbi:MAG: asparagine synthase (glutamine-hydrolyzing) [Pseudomonadota bacterium]
MCGITGFVTFRPGDAARLEAQARAMSDAIAYRGPDSDGVWVDEEAGFATGHRRLAIVDLSEAGAQPMISADERYVLCYNGEVYNAEDLRAELSGYGINYRGHSDTEVILEAWARWGPRQTVEKLIGMFTLCVWDRRDKRMWLVRDRLGIKPLYWGRFGDLLLFGSELKALRAHPDWPVEVDYDAIAAYLRLAYIPAPRSIYRGIQKLLPGTILEIAPGEAPRIETYWSLDEVVRTGTADRFSGSDEEAEEALEALLGDAVKRRMIADVPLGAFLSGGIDSSCVAALMQAGESRPVRTFSIGFAEDGYDEAPHARAVAEHLGTDHTELYVDPVTAQDVIPRLPFIYDEPFADVSQIPTFLVSEMTRRDVTVALSGDGGDELFGGYNRYLQGARLDKWLTRLPEPVRAAVRCALTSVSPARWDQVFAALPARMRPQNPGNKMHKLAGALKADADQAYLQFLTQWPAPETLLHKGKEPAFLTDDPGVKTLVPDTIERMQFIDAKTYMVDDILTKVDRASMSVALEARVPILDHRVVEFAWRLPAAMKIRDGKGKWLLRRVLSRHVPDRLIDRPKMGFGVPIEHWLRGPLRDWAENLLSPAALTDNGLNPHPIRAKWEAHQSGRENQQYPLWTLLMLQSWFAEAR